MVRKNTEFKKGMTFIEMLVVIAVSTIVMAAVASSIVFFYRTNTYTMEQALAINSARRGIEIAVKHIREAAYSDEGAYPVISISENEFSFYSDIDNDASVEKVRLFIENGSFKEGITNSAGSPPTYTGQPEEINILSEDVRNIEEATKIFTYYGSDGSEIVNYANILDVTFAGIKLIVNINPARLPNQFDLNSSATLRNIQNSL